MCRYKVYKDAPPAKTNGAVWDDNRALFGLLDTKQVYETRLIGNRFYPVLVKDLTVKDDKIERIK